MKSRTFAALILLLIGSIFSAIGIVIGLVFGKPVLDDAKASEQWPQAPGEILTSELEESRGEGGTMYGARVTYRYALDGGSFESSRIWFGGDYSTSERSEIFEVVKRYPAGRTVTVYYSPDNPAESVLMPGAYFSSYLMFSIGMVFLTIGGVLLLIFVFMFVRSITGFRSGESHFFDAAFEDSERQDGWGK